MSKYRHYRRFYSHGPRSLSEAVAMDNRIAKMIQNARLKQIREKGGENMTNKYAYKGVYTIDDVGILLSQRGKTSRTKLADLVGRTPQAISTLYWHYDLYHKGNARHDISAKLRRVFDEYEATQDKSRWANAKSAPSNAVSLQETATEVRKQVHQETSDRDELVQSVDKAFEALKLAVVELVESEAKRARQEAEKGVQDELHRLRQLKEHAQESSVAGLLRNKLKGLYAQEA